MQISQKQELRLIVGIVFLGFMGISMPYLVFPPLFLNLEYSLFDVSWSLELRQLFLGLTLATYPTGQFLGSPVLGAMSDRLGRKRVLATSLLFTAAFNLLTAVALYYGSFALLLISRFGAGVMEGNLAIARAMASDLHDLDKQSAFGKINAAGSTAYILGPIFGGLLAEYSSWAPFLITAALFLGLSTLTQRLLSESPFASGQSESIWEQFRIVKRARRLMSGTNMARLIALSFVFTLAVDTYYEFGPIFLTELWSLSPAALSGYNAVLSISLTFGSAYLTAFLAKRYNKQWITPAAMALFGGSLAIMVLLPHPLTMYLYFACAGIGIAVGVTQLSVDISDAAPAHVQGEVMGILTSTRVLGDAFLCLLGGFLLSFSAKIIIALAALLACGVALAATPEKSLFSKGKQLNPGFLG